MLATIDSVTFNGIDVLRITIEEQITSGMPSFKVFGLADKTVVESRKRVHAATDMAFSDKTLPRHFSEALVHPLPERKS